MNIFEKIAAVQDEIQNVKKDSKNPHFHNTYATYEQVINTVYPILRKHKMMSYHTILPSQQPGHVNVCTIIRDLEGDSENVLINSEFEMPLVKQDPQAAGSAITYAKRYSLLALLGLGTEDDDGEAASGPVVTKDNDVMERAMDGGECPRCGAAMAKSAKGNWYCSKVCWNKGKA